MPRRVWSDSAAKMRSSRASEYLTIRFSIGVRRSAVKTMLPGGSSFETSG
jgi:hypothetical protein